MKYPKDMTLDERVEYYEDRISRLNPPRHRSDIGRIDFYRRQLEQIKKNQGRG